LENAVIARVYRFQPLENLCADMLCLEGEAVLGEVLFVADLDELFLEGFVDGGAFVFAVEPGEMFFFAAGVDSFGAGGFLRVAQFAQNIAGGFFEGDQVAEVFDVDGHEEVAESVGLRFSIFANATERA